MTQSKKFAVLDLDGEHPGEGDQYEEKIELIKSLSFKEKWILCEDKIDFFDRDFQKALLQGIYDTHKNKSLMYQMLFDLIGYEKGIELDKYLESFIYDNNLK